MFALRAGHCLSFLREKVITCLSFEFNLLLCKIGLVDTARPIFLLYLFTGLTTFFILLNLKLDMKNLMVNEDNILISDTKQEKNKGSG